jgi:hypothetical protein
MTDPREAAERFANPKPAEAYPWPCDMTEQPAQRVADMATLARAYLAQARSHKPLREALQALMEIQDCTTDCWCDEEMKVNPCEACAARAALALDAEAPNANL